LNPLNIKGVVFDFDATLVNLGEHVRWREAQQQIIKTYRENGCSDSDITKCSSKGLFNLMYEMDTLLSASKPPAEMAMIRESTWVILDKYEMEGVERCGLMPGANESLNWLRDNSVKMGVCTSNSGNIADKILNNLGVSSYFDSVIGRTIGLRMKPFPDQVLKCFKGIGISPREGVMVGDSHNDVLAAKAAGARAIAIPVYFTRKEAMEAAKPDAVITSMMELPKVLITFK